jgi:hypothetical protein
VAEAIERPNERLVDIIVSNFAAFSAGLTAIGASLSVIFVFGYLASFDMFLIMTIEYTDVLKFVLIGTCVAFGLWAAFFYVINIGVNLANQGFSRAAIVIIIVVSVLAVLPAFVAWKNATSDFHYSLSRMSCILIGLLLVSSVAYWSKRIKTMTFMTMLAIIFLSYLFVYFRIYLRPIRRRSRHVASVTSAGWPNYR